MSTEADPVSRFACGTTAIRGDGPLITAGITAYNSQDTLERCLCSVRWQTWAALEIIVVDDASTDDTWNKLKRIASQDDRIIVIRHEKNEGVAQSRNDILKAAKGEFVAFFDDDDVSVVDRIAVQYGFIREYEQTCGIRPWVLCHTGRLQHYPDGVLRYEGTVGTDVRVPVGDEVVGRILTGKPVAGPNGSCATCSQMAPLALYRELGGFDPLLRRSEDTDLNLRAACIGAHFVGVGRPLVIQEMTPTEDKAIIEERECWFRLLDKHRGLLSGERQLRFCRRWSMIKYDYQAGNATLASARLLATVGAYPVHAIRRILWALPSISRNRRLRAFRTYLGR